LRQNFQGIAVFLLTASWYFSEFRNGIISLNNKGRFGQIITGLTEEDSVVFVKTMFK